MSSPTNLCLVLVACLQVFVTVVPSTATPLPLPLALMMADYSPSFIPANHSFSNLLMTWRDVGLTSSLPSHQRRDTGSFNNLLQSYNAAKSHANNLKGLAAKSSSVDANDRDFQGEFVTALTGFNTNMDGFSNALVDSTSAGSGGSDKGLANYDSTNSLETVLKDMVNLNKNVLSATSRAVDNLPVLGPVLGPLVYALKCLIDQILNAVEDCSDSIIEEIQPLLAELLGQAVSASCRSGVELLGLCV